MQPTQKLYLLLFISACSLSQAQNTDKYPTLPIDNETGCYIRYHYFPNLQAYYDNLAKIYYYKMNGEWITNEELPMNYSGYSIFNKAKVVVKDFDGDNPHHLINIHKKLYPYNSKGRINKSTVSNNDKLKGDSAKT